MRTAELSKVERQVAGEMNDYHWRMWVDLTELSKRMKKRGSTVEAVLRGMQKRKLVEVKKGESKFRLLPTARKIVNATA
jgi:DNA-binding MarR family transcriptional regulator